MKTIDILRFQKSCLALMAQIQAEGILITQNKKPIAKVTPLTGHRDLIACLKSQLKINGDIVATGGD